MPDDTYRYLMSALMQVFGALVALDAVFLVFKQQNMIGLKSKLLFQIGRYVSLLVRYRTFSFEAVRSHIDEIERNAAVFETRPVSLIIKSVDDAEKCLAEHRKVKTSVLSELEERQKHGTDSSAKQTSCVIDGVKREMDEIDRVESLWRFYTKGYFNILQKEKRLPTLLVATMGVPSLLVIVFSVGLCLAGRMSETGNAWFGCIAIGLGAISLAFLVWAAHDVMAEPVHCEGA